MTVFLIAAVGMAGAQEASISPTLSQTPDQTWSTNGIVYSMIRDGGYVYVGGRFQTVRNTATGESFRATNLARFDATTGVADRNWTPDVTGTDVNTTTVYALAAAGGNIWVGGRFDNVDGFPHRHLAAVSSSTGVVDSTVDPMVGVAGSEGVRAMVASGTRVYVGGLFGSIDGKTRQYLAELDFAGNVDPVWKPKAGAGVRSLSLSCDGATVFAGGKFRNAAGSDGVFSPRETLARFDAVSGALDPWAIPTGIVNNDQVAADLAVTCGQITAGYLGNNYVRSFRLDTGSTGTQVWEKKCGGDVQTVAMLGTDKVIIGGHFHQVGYSSNVDSVKRVRIAKLNLSNGALDSDWKPAVDGQFYGPWDLLVDDTHLYVGGAFQTLAGVTQPNFGRFDLN